LIIQQRASKLRKSIEVIFTLAGWGFLAVFLFNLATHFQRRLSFAFYTLTISNTGAIVLFTLLTLIIGTGTLLYWSHYNKKKFGGLTRRKPPEPVTTKEIAEFFQLTESDVEKLQNEKYITLN
jgi:poly-beta-1,6-N-acetyl-D-glucosamine biosynthesis protein PgaD